VRVTTRRVIPRPVTPEPGKLKVILPTAVRTLAVHDVVVCTYLAAIALAVLIAPADPLRTRCLRQSWGLFAVTAAVVAAFRSRLLGRNAVASLLYRTALIGAIVASYLMLRGVLPVVSPGTLDRELYALDVALFAGEPAIWMERFASPAATQWFAFWYFAYFAVLAAYAAPLWLGRSWRPRLANELCLGIALTFCTNHLLYIAVPGWGPHVFLADRFQAPLPDGPWTAAVRDTVSAGGALKDIFPSLHTAAPTMLALFAFRHRHEPPFPVAWPLTAFAALNGTIATMFLRWHYAVDVVAGLALAFAVSAASARLADWEAARRSRAGYGPAWPPLARDPTGD